MVLQAGAVLVRPGYIRLKLNGINVFVACSLLIAGTMECAYFNRLEIFALENICKFKETFFTHKIINNAKKSLRCSKERLS